MNELKSLGANRLLNQSIEKEILVTGNPTAEEQQMDLNTGLMKQPGLILSPNNLPPVITTAEPQKVILRSLPGAAEESAVNTLNDV